MLWYVEIRCYATNWMIVEAIAQMDNFLIREITESYLTFMSLIGRPLAFSSAAALAYSGSKLLQCPHHGA
jgi:hypothetical protein